MTSNTSQIIFVESQRTGTSLVRLTDVAETVIRGRSRRGLGWLMSAEHSRRTRIT